MYFSVDHAALECVAVVGRRNIEVSIAMALRDCFFECLTIRWQYDEHSVLPRDVAAKRLIVSFWTDVNVAGLIALLDRFRFINVSERRRRKGPMDVWITQTVLS